MPNDARGARRHVFRAPSRRLLRAKDVAEARQRQGDIEASVQELAERVRPDGIDDPAGLPVDPDLPLVDEGLVAAADDCRHTPDVDERAEPGLRVVEVRRVHEVIGALLEGEAGDGVPDGVVLLNVRDDVRPPALTVEERLALEWQVDVPLDSVAAARGRVRQGDLLRAGRGRRWNDRGRHSGHNRG
jgi:hypothetical protein